MNYRFLAFLSVAALLAVFSSCKKEEEDTTKEYMDGYVYLSFPSYANPGEVYKFDPDTLSTLSRASGNTDSIGYYFYDSYTDVKDTVRLADGTVVKKVYTYTVPDTLATVSLSLVGFSEGYYTSSASQDVTVVKEGFSGEESITGFSILPEDKTFTDARDGRKYYYTTVGGVDWMRQNLAWTGAGEPYDGAPAAAGVFGMFYTRDEALTACPEGWSLPFEADWVKLAKDLGCEGETGGILPGVSGKLMENISFNGSRMWEYWPAVEITNAARFSAIPVGFATITLGAYGFSLYGQQAMFWSADPGTGGFFRFIHDDNPGMYFGSVDPGTTAMSVRCLRK